MEFHTTLEHNVLIIGNNSGVFVAVILRNILSPVKIAIKNYHGNIFYVITVHANFNILSV